MIAEVASHGSHIFLPIALCKNLDFAVTAQLQLQVIKLKNCDYKFETATAPALITVHQA